MLAQGASEKNLKQHVSVEKKEVYNVVQTVFHSIYTKIVFVLSVLSTLIIATVIRGEHVTFYVYIKKWLEKENATVPADIQGINRLLYPYYMNDLPFFIFVAWIPPLFSFLTFAGILVLKYNILQKNRREDWKCQPKRENNLRQMMGGMAISTMNMSIGGLMSGFMATYVINGGPTMLYFDIHERGLLYIPLSAVGFFILQEASAYYTHRVYHWPSMYKTIHKWHHWYQYPSALHAIVFHPLEFVHSVLIVYIPVFFLPMHVGVLILILIWQYYYGVIDHSGIDMTPSIWPWQPTVRYHDYHHKAFHVNMGFNLYLFDWLHDTYYKGDRIYTEDSYSYKGQKKVIKEQ